MPQCSDTSCIIKRITMIRQTVHPPHNIVKMLNKSVYIDQDCLVDLAYNTLPNTQCKHIYILDKNLDRQSMMLG